MTEYEHRSDRFTAVEDRYAGYTVVDESGSKIGKVDDLFLDENDQPEYFGVKMGLPGHQLHPDPGRHRHCEQRARFHRGLPAQEHRPGRAGLRRRP
jgi:hypothetical protein